MENILLLTDFTKTSHQAIEHALELFHKDAVNYTLLNAFHVKYATKDNTYEKERFQHQSDLNDEVGIFKQKINSKSTLTSVLWPGKIDFLPKEIIEENKIDLVIMGTEGISTVENYIGKSHAGEFVSHVDANTLIIPRGVSYKNPQNILFTTNYKNVNGAKTLEKLKSFVDKYDANLFILYVNDTDTELTNYQQEIKKQLHDYFIENKVSFHEFSAASIEEEIESFMKQYNIDLVTAIPLHNNIFDRLFHSSLSKNLTEHATKPVLILTNKM